MKKNSLSINIVLYVFLNLMLLTLFNDYFSFFISTSYNISIVFSIILVVALNVLIKNKIKLVKDFSKWDLIFFITLFFIMAITIVYPDRSFDTINYHLYLQENPFGDKLNFDFFAGKNLNSYSYAFPDRIFYFFRYFLGYRLGVILNYFAITVIYYQCKNILKKLISTPNEIAIVIFSLLTALSLSIVDIVDSYYVDILSIALFLEIINRILFYKLNEKEDNTLLFAYFGLLFGLIFAIKISNAVLLILLFIIYIIKNKNILKCLNIKNVLITLICLLFPFILYLLYTYIQTGNPVFPFYNTVFKSEYFGIRNWLDTRFGPSTLFETLIWPVYIIFHPQRADDIAIIEPIWGYGYVIIVYSLLIVLLQKFFFKKKINNEYLLFLLTSFFIYLMWSKFQLGYSRYGLIALVLGCLSTYIFINDIIKKKKFIFVALIFPAMMYNFAYSFGNYMYRNKDWVYNNYFNNSTNYSYNLKNLLATGNENRISFEKNSAWAIFYCNAGLAQFINSDIPIINVVNGPDNELTHSMLYDRLSKFNHIYTLVDSLDFQNFIDAINTTDFRIISVNKVLSSAILGNENKFVYVFEIERTGSYNANSFSIFQTKDYDVSGKTTLQFMVGIAKDLNKNYGSDLPLYVVGEKNGIETIIDKLTISKNGNIISVSYDINDYEKISLKSYGDDGEINLNNWFMTINVDLK